MNLKAVAAPESFRLFNRYWALPAAVCLAFESALLYFSVWLAYQIRFLPVGYFPYGAAAFRLRACTFVVVALLSLYFHGLYDLARPREGREHAILQARSLVSGAVALSILYYFVPSLWLGRGLFLMALAISGVSIALSRWLLGLELDSGLFKERVLIVGDGAAARELAREILERRHLGYEVVGFLSDSPALRGKKLMDRSIVGSPAEAWRSALEVGASRIVVAQSDNRGHLDVDALLECEARGLTVERSSDYYEHLTGKILLGSRRVKSWLAFSGGLIVSRVTLAAKRALDIVVSGLGLVLVAPVLAIAGAAIKLSSPGPILFRQERIGRGGEVFEMLKLRSMCDDAERGTGARWAAQNDSRVTRVGRLLRRAHLDELPQLWNVLVGHMSLVGPRPERPQFVRRLTRTCRLYEKRHAVRPGITGWAQIMAPYAASVGESEEKLKYDLYYIKNLSLGLDLSIIASTIRIALLGRGSR